MKCICSTCGNAFDDARSTTICPHDPLMSDRDMNQKELAISLLGKPVYFAHQIGGASFFIESIGWTGMVTLRGMSGEFAPHLFAVAEDQNAGVSQAAKDVLAERQRQIEAEGWTPEHDDKYNPGEMACAAVCYATPISLETVKTPPDAWPWSFDWWKPSTYRRNLIKAAALIIAEIERLDRAASKEAAHG